MSLQQRKHPPISESSFETLDALLEHHLKGKTPYVEFKLTQLHGMLVEMLRSGRTDFRFDAIRAAGSRLDLWHSGAKFASPIYAAYYRDWRLFASAATLPDVTGLADDHPTRTLRELLERGVRPDLAFSLRAMHGWCSARYENGIREFSGAAILPLLATDLELSKATFRRSDYEMLRMAWDTYAWKDAPRKPDGRRIQRNHDKTFSLTRRDHPELKQWCDAAQEWLETEKNPGTKLSALNYFMVDFVLQRGLSLNPTDFLLASNEIPDFSEEYKDIANGQTPVNTVSNFLENYLLKHCSDESDQGYRVISPLFRNPVSKIKGGGGSSQDITVQTPLPYGMIDELRQLLIEGPNFRDWEWAQTSAGVAVGKKGAQSDEWFDVRESDIDSNDPDCVHRRVVNKKGKVRFQIWSPVRSCALAVKLILPARGSQVRWLDSGEADALRYEGGAWHSNDHPLARAGARRGGNLGVLRKPTDFDRIGEGGDGAVSLYINTNKSASGGKQSKGYTMPWYKSDDITANAFYWLEKMRNWQEKYNPIHRLTEWKELDGRHMPAKSDAQLLTYPPVAFLFRTREAKVAAERTFPVSAGVLDHAWTRLLWEYEQRLEQVGRTHEDGSKIRLTQGDKSNRAAIYSLHVIRVSLLTALAMDAGVPFNILKRIAGHSRLVMTIYYVKGLGFRMTRVLQEAEMKMKAEAPKIMLAHLSSVRHEELATQLASRHYESLRRMIPIIPSDRNPAGFANVHNGVCLAGGNTSETGSGRVKSAGCHNGFPEVVDSIETGQFLPVPGGPKNCVQCRWLVTGPEFLPPLVATFNHKSYQLDEMAIKVRKVEAELQALLRGRAKAEAIGGIFDHGRELKEAQMLVSNHIADANQLAEDMVCTYQLITTCVELAKTRPAAGQLVVHGSGQELMVALDDVDSELLQLSGICRDSAIYRSLDADKATLRTSQFLDAALYDEGYNPIFLRLDPEQQRDVGVAFLDSLGRKMNAKNPEAGRLQAISTIEAGEKLSQLIGVPLHQLLPQTEEIAKLAVRRAALPLEQA